jgi:hypothetical protein
MTDAATLSVISREQAIASGGSFYFTGIPCKNGHTDKRYAKTGVCYECHRRNNARDRLRHHDRAIASDGRNYQKHKAKLIEKSRAWHLANPERSRLIKKRNKIRHRDKYMAAERLRQAALRLNPANRIENAISLGVWRFMKGKKSGRGTSTILMMKISGLVDSIVSKLTDGMSLANYGRWHVDHIVPVSLFMDWFPDKEWSAVMAWQPSNLRPLWGQDNLSKGDRLIDGWQLTLLESAESYLETCKESLKDAISCHFGKDRGTLQGSGDNR